MTKYKLTKSIDGVGVVDDIVELTIEEFNVLPFNSTLERIEEKKPEKNNKTKL